VDSTVTWNRIEEAGRVIDPTFLDTPQFDCEPISQRLGVTTVFKVECVNPIRSFKGRGTDYLLHRLPADGRPIVCASAGNFGQGMAYACRKAHRNLTVFAATTASPIKVERMRALGAHVVLQGADFDEAKDVAMHHATAAAALYVEDGLLGPIAEGAGTIARELTQNSEPFNTIFVPLGNGSLVNGIGTWLKRFSPATRVIAVCPAAAPAMELSWKAGEPVTAGSTTIADGIAVRVPVPEALDIMRGVVDEVMLVSDDEIVDAMRTLFVDAGLVVEPAGAAGLAAITQRKAHLAGQRVVTPLTGANLTTQQIREWLL
jgi:threonine dehydratase